MIDWHGMSFLPRGLVDEPCHLATAVVVMGALTRWRGRGPGRLFVRAMLLGVRAHRSGPCAPRARLEGMDW